MKVLEVIESRCWKHKDGRTASPYGACPWSSQKDKSNWKLEIVGWTWRMSNGTVGLGRRPAATKEEAIEVMERINNR